MIQSYDGFMVTVMIQQYYYGYYDYDPLMVIDGWMVNQSLFRRTCIQMWTCYGNTPSHYSSLLLAQLCLRSCLCTSLGATDVPNSERCTTAAPDAGLQLGRETFEKPMVDVNEISIFQYFS